MATRNQARFASKVVATTTVASMLVALTVPGCGDGGSESVAAAGGHRPTATQAGPVDPSQPAVPADELLDTDERCGLFRIWFHGQCRDVSYFAKFLDDGATMVNLAGPRTKTPEGDTGVALSQSVADNASQTLFIKPDKLAPGQVGRGDYQYRSGFPVVAIRTTTIWRDSDGFMNQLIQLQGSTTRPVSGSHPGPARVWGTVRWTQWTETISGYCMYSDKGPLGCAIADGTGSGSSSVPAICDDVGVEAKQRVINDCYAFLHDEEVLTLTAGILVGAAAVFIIGTDGLGIPVVLGILGAGITVGGAVANAENNTGSKQCDAEAELAASHAKAACMVAWLGAPPPPTDPELHADPDKGVIDPSVQCPNGTVSFTGYATWCPAGGDSSSGSSSDGTSGSSSDGTSGSSSSGGANGSLTSHEDDSGVLEITVVGTKSALAVPVCFESFLNGVCVTVD